MIEDDRELALRAGQGDRGAFVRLVERHRRLVYAVAWRVVLNEEDALDVAQEALAKLARKIGQYRGDGSFRGWLSTLVTREALNLLRRPGRRERPVDPATLAGLADRDGGSRAEARDRIEHGERRAMVETAMARLPPQQRAIVALRLGEDLTSAEVARRLDLPKAQVRSQLSRAVARLREIMGIEPRK